MKDIINKSLSAIKKWGIKITVESNQILMIPPEWYYAYESKLDTIVVNVEADTYVTYLFNYIRSL